MSEGLYSHTSRATGTVLTAAIYNTDHTNHVTNQNPSMTGHYCDNLAQKQLTSDPGGLGSEVMAGSLAVELEHLRFCIKRITGAAQWYIAPPTDLTAMTPANDSITNAKLANMAAGTYKMRVTASTGDPEDATATQATAGLNAVVGDSGSGGTKGLVPAPSAGDAAAGKLLSADGTFRAPATQSQMETGTSLVEHVTPARQHYHPGHPKAWLNCELTGTVSVRSSYNVSSINDDGVGTFTVNFTTAFATTDYAAAGYARSTTSTPAILLCSVSAAAKTTSAMQFSSAASGSGAELDSNEIGIIFVGDQ